MKPLLLLFLFLYYLLPVNGQARYPLFGNEAAFYFVPKSSTHSTDAIAAYIKEQYKTDREKLQAIYSWVTTNIRYDTDSMLPINWSLDRAEMIAATLRRRRGVCENYAALFSDISSKAGFPSFVINGYTQHAGNVNTAGHSWSAVMLDEQWYLCDPTWDISRSTNFFLIKPEQFIQTHIPFDPLWQLLEYPITAAQFRRGAFYSGKERAPLNTRDSVNAFLQLDSLQQLEAAATRIKKAGIENERIQNWVAYNQMKIAIINSENDMNLYNEAVDNFNKAREVYNQFVAYRNNRFMPSRPDNEMSRLLQPMDGLLSAARKKLDQVGRAKKNDQYDTGPLLESIRVLSNKKTIQQTFLQQYLNSAMADRGKLFYR